ncbi:uncharacterized protein [Miscanthus floridulus]|uniref:uncharacterized protein isoform X2 n=1 Tax=Miscanthus floridulus TaxID=154761 RepID=UPI003457EA8B
MFAQLKELPTAKDEYSAANPPPDHLGRNFMDLPPLPPPPPAKDTGASARSAARVGEELADSKATLTDIQGDRRQGEEAGKKRARSPSVESEDSTPLQRRPRRATRKQSESTPRQQEPAAREVLENSIGPDVVAQIKSHLLEIPDLGDDSVSFGGATPLASRKLSAFKKIPEIKENTLPRHDANPMVQKEASTGNLGMDPALSTAAAEPVPNVEVPGSSAVTERQATQLEQPSNTHPRLESYAPSLGRAREAWSVASSKAAEFDSIFKDLRVCIPGLGPLLRLGPRPSHLVAYP